MATKTIGPSGDYTTLAAYATYLDALNTLTAPEVGEVQNTALSLGSTQVNFTGFTPDATNTWTLTAAAGAGFKDNGSAATNALRYNASNGAAITGSVAYSHCILVSVPFAIIQNLQITNTATNGRGPLRADGANFLAENCILETDGGDLGFTGSVHLNATGATLRNSISIVDTSAAQVGVFTVTNATLINVTVVRPTNRTTGGTGIDPKYDNVTIQNCLIAGFSTAIGSGATKTGSGNAIDTGSYPSGPTGQVSLTIATEFEEPSNASGVMDWRLKSTSVAAKDNGTNSGAPTTDIIGQAISNTIRDAGAWELQQGGGGPQTLTPSLFTNTSVLYGPEVKPTPDTIATGPVFWPSLNPVTWSYGSLLSLSGWFDRLLVAATAPGTPTLFPGLLTNTSTFYTPTITTGSVTLSPGLVTNTSTFYSPTVSQGGSTQTLTPGLLTNTSTFYSPTVTRGTVTLSPGLLTNTSTFYAATVTRGTVTLSPGLLTNSSTFYTPTVTTTRTLAPSLFTNSSTFYAPTVTKGAARLSPGLLTNVSTFYPATVAQPSLQTLSPGLLTNVSVFYGPTANQNDPPGTYPLAIEGNPTTTKQALLGGGSVVAGSITSTGRVVAGYLRGRP